MTRISTAVVAATMTSAMALMGSASAADVYAGGSLKDAPVAPLPVCTWCGFYIGGHLGVALSDDDDAKFEKGDYYDNYNGYYYDKNKRNIEDDFLFDDDDDHEFIGGIHLGYNWQRPGSSIVFGVEGDIDFADGIDYLASLRGRIGAGSEQALVYLTAGVAFIEADNGFDVKYNGYDSAYPNYVDEYGPYSYKVHKNGGGSDTETGWVIGGGVEFKPAQRVSFGIEALYYSFDVDGGKHDLYSEYYIDEAYYKDHVGSFEKDDEFDFWQIRARLSFHTGPRYDALPPVVPLK